MRAFQKHHGDVSLADDLQPRRINLGAFQIGEQCIGGIRCVNLDREIAAPADPFRAVGEYLRFSALYITLE